MRIRLSRVPYFVAWLRHFTLRHPMARLYWREDYYMRTCPHDGETFTSTIEIRGGRLTQTFCGPCGAVLRNDTLVASSSADILTLDVTYPDFAGDEP